MNTVPSPKSITELLNWISSKKEHYVRRERSGIVTEQERRAPEFRAKRIKNQGLEAVRGRLQRAEATAIMPKQYWCPMDVLTLSSVAALSIFTSGSSRLPGPGPMRDTTPLQSTVLFLFPPEWGASGWIREEPWL